MAQIIRGAFAHRRYRGPLLVRRKVEGIGGRRIVVEGTQPVVPRRNQIAPGKRRKGPVVVGIGGLRPFLVPGIVVGEVDTACGEPAFGNRRAALLGCRQQPHELQRKVLPLRPADPPIGVQIKPHVEDACGGVKDGRECRDPGNRSPAAREDACAMNVSANLDTSSLVALMRT